MAEHDATAPTPDSGTTRGPVAEPCWKLADIYRAVKRSMAPLLALQAGIEKRHRDLAEAFGQPAGRIRRDVLGEVTEEELAEMAGHSVAKCSAARSEVRIDEDALAERIKDKVFPKKPRNPRGPTTCERLQKLDKEDPAFLVEAAEKAIAKRIGRKSAGSFSRSTYWLEKVRPRREEVRARRRSAKRGIKNNPEFATISQARSANWEHREQIVAIDEQIDATWNSGLCRNRDAAIEGGHSS